jgi:CHAT domain-containing protein/predicted negative regulator of RcsB-dependent stress response
MMISKRNFNEPGDYLNPEKFSSQRKQGTIKPGKVRILVCKVVTVCIHLLVLSLFWGNTAFSSEVPGAAEEQKTTLATTASPPAVSASGYYDQGVIAFQRGAFADAINDFEAALKIFEDEAHKERQTETLLKLSDALQSTGQYKKALQNLEKALVLAKDRDDKHQTASVLGAMGNVHIGLGNTEKALDYLNQGLAMAREAGFADGEAAILNNLGNLFSAQGKCKEAFEAYQQSKAVAQKAAAPALAALAATNSASVALRCGNYNDTLTQVDWAAEHDLRLEDSYSKAFFLINAGIIYSDLRRHFPDKDKGLIEKSYTSFKEALGIALKINDPRTISYAYGHLGRLYEDSTQYKEALDLTEKAVFSAQQADSTEALYKWHWQYGRILAHMGKIDEALVSYRETISDLHAIRVEMSSCYANPESSYRKTSSNVCFELVKLLLKRSSMLKPGESAEPYLREARETLEIVKVYELREYFKDDCIDADRVTQKSLDTVSEKVMVVYPILLDDKVELLVSFNGHLKRFTLPVGNDTLSKEVRKFREKLEKRTTYEFLPHAQKLYDWIIRPLEKDLDATNPDTLVFVPDGSLRTIPMGALHDGKQFLIERFPIAITPSLNLTDPRPLDHEHAKVLALGLTEPVQGFPGLPYVSDELKAIKDLYGGRLLMNEAFRLSNVEKEIGAEPFSIVHIASHGHFGGKVSNTFILAYDEQFTMDRFGQWIGLFRFRGEPLDLLTLSACETAAGDDQAALGLAGIAVRAGARSALATLWHVNDPASNELVVEFYHQLQISSTSRAAALQAAQLKLLGDIRYDHPGYWAPFLLINNWL